MNPPTTHRAAPLNGDHVDNTDGWSIAAHGDLMFTSETGECLYVPRNRIAALVDFLHRARPLWGRE